MANLVALGFAGSFMIETSESADDLADRLSYKYTVNMLLLYAFIVTAKSYIVGEPIHCWVPAHFTGNHEEYANNYCWVRNTYYVPMDKPVPGQFDHEERQVVTYYQWMAFILLIQALLFYLPIRVWHSFCKHSGLDLANVVEGCKVASTLTGDKLESALDKIDTHVSRYLKDGLKSSRPGDCSLSPARLTTCTCCPLGSRKHGTYLVTRYIIVKFIFLINVITQFFALDSFLGYDFHMYGIHVLSAAIKGEAWSDSPRFPRVTLCDLNVRRLANVQRYTVQCVLPINLFNEKLFFIMWFWFLIIMFATVISILRWSLRLATTKLRKDYVKKHVTLKKELKQHVTDERLDEFVEYLRRDGLFTLRLMGHNVNTVSVSDVVAHMWKKYFGFDTEFEERHVLPNDDDADSDSVLEEKVSKTPVDTIVTEKA